MLRKIHCTMQQPRHLNHILLHPKQDQMARLGDLLAGGYTLAAGRQLVGADALANVVPLPHAPPGRVGAQDGPGGAGA